MAEASVVVTGIGLATALGADRESSWAALASGHRGLGPLTLFALPGREPPVVAQLPPEVERALAGRVQSTPGLPRRALAHASRTDRLALAVALEAVADAGLAAGDLARAAVVLGASSGGMLEGEAYHRELLAHGPGGARRSRLAGLEASSATGRVALALGCRGPRATFTTACSSSAHALGHALDLVRSGAVPVALAGGADGLCGLATAGFLSLENVSRGGCRPFARDRDGMTVGEGAAILVLEAADRARARGARARARILGTGAASEAWHPTATDPEGKGAERAIRAALADAGLAPEEIDVVNAHAPGTRDDAVEATALARVLAHRPPVSSTKALHGHALGAAAAIEAAVACLGLERGLVPGQGPTPLEPGFPLDLVETTRPRAARHALSLSLAFGGNDAALVLGAPP